MSRSSSFAAHCCNPLGIALAQPGPTLRFCSVTATLLAASAIDVDLLCGANASNEGMPAEKIVDLTTVRSPGLMAMWSMLPQLRNYRQNCNSYFLTAIHSLRARESATAWTTRM